MQYWVQLTADSLAEVFTRGELDRLTTPDNAPYVDECLGDVTAEVREAVANNRANALDADQTTIPRTLKTCALDIIAVRLLKRFSIDITDARQQADQAARERLKAVANAEWQILAPDGTMPADPADIPAIIAPAPAYGNDGNGYYPEP